MSVIFNSLWLFVNLGDPHTVIDGGRAKRGFIGLHDLIVDLIVILVSEHLRVLEYQVHQFALVLRHNPLRSHMTTIFFRFKEEVDAGVRVDPEVLAGLVPVHVNLAND